MGVGVEETLESVLNPFLQQLTYDKNVKTILQDPSLLANAAYEGLIGTVLGLFGSGTSTAIDLVSNMIYDGIMPGEKLMEAAGVSEPEVLGAMAMNEMGTMEEATDSSFNSNLKTEILEKNRLQGKMYEQQGFSKFSQQYSFAEEQITIKTDSDVRVRVDAIGLDSDGNVVINEFKSSSTAPLTKNQKIAFEEIPDNGGSVVGKGKGIFSGGYRIPAGTKIEIIRPE